MMFNEIKTYEFNDENFNINHERNFTYVFDCVNFNYEI